MAELSLRLYEKLLKKIFLESGNDLPYHKKITFYCFYHRGISLRQIGIIFGNSNNKIESMKTTLDRMINKEDMQRFKYGKSNETGYYITPKGIREGSILVRDFFESKMSDEKLSRDYYDFTFDDIIEYLSNRCSACQPKYWQHYLASRDVFAYLLNGKFQYHNFHYETEVAIEESGRPATLYTRSLFGMDLRYQVRTDGMLSFIISKDKPIFRFFMEVDNCSQSSLIITNKVSNYIKNYIETREFSITTSLMFCINTDSVNERPIKKNKYTSTTDYYYGLLLVSVYDMLLATGMELSDKATINEVLSFIEDRSKCRHSDALNQVSKYFRSKTSFFKGHMPIKDLNDLYKEQIAKRQRYINDENEIRHYKKYITRRKLIHRSIINIPGLHEAFLRGFSIYTASNYDLDKTLPFINIEMTKKKYKFKRMLMKYNLVNDDFEYEVGFAVKKTNILLRNVYYSKKERRGIAIENVSDDLGGFYRVKNILEKDSIPSYMLRNILIICLCDNRSINYLKERYLETKQGKILSKKCTNYIKNEFEVLFLKYEEAINDYKLFSFSATGEIIYKVKPLIREKKGWEELF